MITVKAPTCVLFNPEGKFHSFGYEAENYYARLVENNEHDHWKYFKCFKTELIKKSNIRRDMKLIDDQGRKMPAIDVFAASINYMKDHLINRLMTRIPGMKDKDIFWVLTVPAIWHDGAKQFMREAAADSRYANIPADHLALAFEPEVAAVYCKELTIARVQEMEQPAELQSFQVGSQFMVADLGGGTVDIMVVEIQGDNTLKELFCPSGGPWGGMLVNGEILQLIKDLLGEDVIDELKKTCKDEYLDLERTIELKKREFKSSKHDRNDMNSVLMTLPHAMFEIFEKLNEMSFEKHFASTKPANITKTRDKLIIKHGLFTSMFQESIDNIINSIQTLLSKPELANVKTILMVGGFSESAIIQQEVRDAFQSKTVIVPEEAGLAVVKGVSVAKPFDAKKHPATKRVTRNETYLCEDVFEIFVKAGSTIASNQNVVRPVTVPFINSEAVIEIYKTRSENPQFVTDFGCEKVGNINLQLIGDCVGQKQIVNITMKFGDTELHVDACEKDLNNTVHAQFNFLR